MLFRTQTPISYIRSTKSEKSSLVERRHRLRFSLSLDIPNFHSSHLAYSAPVRSELSPSSCPSLSPGGSTPDPPSSGPPTPVGTLKLAWPHQKAADAPEPTPVFNYRDWLGTDISGEDADSGTSQSTGPPALFHFEATGSADAQKQPSLPPFFATISDHSAPSTTSSSKRDSVDAEPTGSESPSPTLRSTPTLRRRSPRSLKIANSGGRARPHSDAFTKNYFRLLSDKEGRDLGLDRTRRHYICLMGGCERVFGRKSNAQNHIRTHLDDKPFVCSLETCQAAFVRKGDLQRHEQIHRPSRLHMCSCGQTFSRNDALMKHIRKGICGPDGSPVTF